VHLIGSQIPKGRHDRTAPCVQEGHDLVNISSFRCATSSQGQYKEGFHSRKAKRWLNLDVEATTEPSASIEQLHPHMHLHVFSRLRGLRNLEAGERFEHGGQVGVRPPVVIGCDVIDVTDFCLLDAYVAEVTVG